MMINIENVNKNWFCLLSRSMYCTRMEMNNISGVNNWDSSGLVWLVRNDKH